MTNSEQLTITVLDIATIFEGPDTVYRYDLPATGIIEGWAVPAVVDQARQMCSVNWPEMDIIIDGSEKVTEMLTRTFIGKGVTSYPLEVLKEQPLPELPTENPVPQRPTTGKVRMRFYGIRPPHILLGGLFIAIVLALWAVFLKPAETG